MRRAWFVLILSLVLLSMALPAHAQGGTPPTPTPDPLEICLAEGLWPCLPGVWRAYGWSVVVALFVLAGVIWILSRFLKGAGSAIEAETRETLRKAWKAESPLRPYLKKALQAYHHFKFRGLPRARAKGIEPPRLDQAYVSLRMIPETGREGARARLAGEGGGAMGVEDLSEKAKPIELHEAIRRFPKLAIIGVAGSGKSTLLQWAGLACARALLGARMSEEQRAFVEALGDKPPTPILFPLRAFDAYCRRESCGHSPQALLESMADYFSRRFASLDPGVDFLRDLLRGRCLLMLDGIDEVDPEHRPAMRQAVEGLIAEFDHADLHCLITSRPSAAYISDQMADFRRCEVQRLEPEQRDRLIHLWYRAVLPEDRDEAQRKADDLCTRIQASPERVQELATTPLMVTIFAMVHYSRDELPRQRAKLYEEAVEVLLTEVPFKEGDEARELTRWGGMEWDVRRDYLARIAFELHLRGVDEMLEADLVDLIWEHFGAEESEARREAARFLRYVAERGGLLEEMDGRYGFYTHATFQEFLAGRYLAEEYPPEELPAFLRDHLEDDRWEEPLRLAAGYLGIRGMRQANRFVEQIAAAGKRGAKRARAITLAGLALSDLPEDRRLPRTVESLRAPMHHLLLANPPRLAAPLRRRLGLALGAIGDPRLLDRLREAEDAHGRRVQYIQPDLVRVPSGPFRMGTSPEEIERLKAQGVNWEDWFQETETPQHLVTLSEYAIGKFPVTNAEFRLFWEAGGYRERAFWSEEGWRWRSGEWQPDLSVYPENVREDVRRWLAGRPVERRDRPFFWGDPRWDAPNLPVVGVTWFEAEAYCNYLRALTGRPYRLPTEAEWEKAARGPQALLWPWGNAWDETRCNNREPEDSVGATTPVGMYPHGESPCGALDMVGNVWEWCADAWQADLYARRAGEGEVRDPLAREGAAARVVRGGSWYDARSSVRCAVRYGLGPGYFGNNIGFRVALSPVGGLNS